MPSGSTRKFGLWTRSHRKPSGSATQALTPPHSRTVGTATDDEEPLEEGYAGVYADTDYAGATYNVFSFATAALSS